MKSRAGLATLLLTAAVAPPAFADGGYYQGALGARAAGRGGAFVARADDVTAVSINPAGLAALDGTVIEVGNQFAYNGYDYTRAPTIDYGQTPTPTQPTTFAKVHNGTPWQALLPFVGASSHLGLRDWAFALAGFAPPGISREQFPQDGGQRYMMVNREAIILDVAASAAWKFHDLFGVGVTLEWITVPRLDYSLVINANPAPGARQPRVERGRHPGADARLGLAHLQRHRGRLVPPEAVAGNSGWRGRFSRRTSPPTARSSPAARPGPRR